MIMKNNILYYGIFLSQDSKNHLQTWWKQNIGDLLPDVLCDHVTINYKPSTLEQGVYNSFVGNLYQINVNSYAQSSKIQCVGVDIPLTSTNGINEIPFLYNETHITVAIDKCTRANPKDSIQLLDSRIYRPGPRLHGRFGALLKNQQIIYKF